MLFSLKINGETHTVDVEPDTPLLWVLRDELGLKGVKFGCGVAACGACTVHMDGTATRSCVLPVEIATDVEITTIEGLAPEGEFTAVQQAWIDAQVPQCGYCQSGMVMAVTALLNENPSPTEDDINAAITNVCRCGSYPRIRQAMAALVSGEGDA